MNEHYAIPAAILEQHTAFLGKTGSGKTSTSKLAVEQVVAQDYRVCILDPIKSDWWGITSSADGKKPGLPFKILGGPYGHIPLHSGAGKAIGTLVGEGKLPLSIIDMADFEPGGLQKFFCDFAPALLKSMRGVLYLVIEEAHEFAPKERAGFGAENMAIHWAKKLATAGRSKGIRIIAATQRVQSLHNAVLGSCETIIAHRLTTPADQKPVLDWLKANGNKEAQTSVAESISSLPRGTAWVCSGEAKIFLQVAFPKFKTFDNAATPSKDGSALHVETAPVDQAELKAIIGDAVKDAEANDPKVLKAEIAHLKSEIQKHIVSAATGITQEVINQKSQAAYSQGYADGREAGWVTGSTVTALSIKTLLNGFEIPKDTVPREITPTQPKLPKPVAAPMAIGPKVDGRGIAPNKVAPPSNLPPSVRRIVDCIHETYPRSVSFDAAARRAGISKRSSAYRSYRAQVTECVEVSQSPDGKFRSLPDYIYTDRMVTGAGVDGWISKLPPSIGKMLKAIADGYQDKATIASVAGISPTSSGLGSGLRELVDLELVVVDGGNYTLAEGL
jgi:hypothetical protein